MATVGSRFKISGVSGEWQWAGTGPFTFLSAGSGVGADLGDAGAALTYVTQGWLDEVTAIFGENGPLTVTKSKRRKVTERPAPYNPRADKGTEANPLRPHGGQ